MSVTHASLHRAPAPIDLSPITIPTQFFPDFQATPPSPSSSVSSYSLSPTDTSDHLRSSDSVTDSNYSSVESLISASDDSDDLSDTDAQRPSPVQIPSLPPSDVAWLLPFLEPDDEVIISCSGAHRFAAFNCSAQVKVEEPSQVNSDKITNHKIKPYQNNEFDSSRHQQPKVFTAYKRVDRKIRPVPGVFPEDAKVIRQFPEDPLASLVPLPYHPPEFQENGRLTLERLKAIDLNPDKFLWPEEEKLFNHILQLHQNAFVFEDSQRGTFREDYFSPYIIPVIPHEPWAYPNIPIPPGIRERVIELLKEKIEADVYEPSQSSYRSRWFCVLKKNGKLRLVHDLQPLNRVTIKEAGLPPNLDTFVQPFAGHQCYTVLDLYWGFDARKVHPTSRDLSAFYTPLGLLRITSLPTGFTNSPAEFQACMQFILQHEMPHKADIFIDDLPIKGPKSIYPDKDGKPEVLAQNSGIRRFIWEHAQDVHRIIHRVQHAGATFSPTKVQMARQTAVIVGRKCTPEGQLPDDQKIQKVLNWPPLQNQKDVRGFLGLCGTVRIWIKDYSLIARPLTELVRKDAEFIWDNRREQAFQQLKQLVTSAPVLHPIDYNSDRPVVLSVDSSIIAVGFILSQEDEHGRKRPARFGSLPMNEREARYSQPKLELYGLYRALRAYRLYLCGIKNLKVEVDAKYIKGMLNEPDLQPNAVINRWIQGIMLFDFELVHVPADRHRGPDALSRRRLASDEEIESEDESWLDDIALHTKISPPAILSATTKAASVDEPLTQIKHFLQTLQTPTFDNPAQKRRFIAKATKYFIKGDTLFKRSKDKIPLKVVLDLEQRQRILEAAHDQLGHRGEHPTLYQVKTRFFWPGIWNDVRKYVRSCHECQIRNTARIHLPLQISAPTKLFARVYLDVLFMPVCQGYRYIVAVRDDLSGASEGRALRKLSSRSVANFFWEEILCRYGMVYQVTTDNGPEIQKAFRDLTELYGIPQITISPYNSRANGVVERGHFTIREALVKMCKGDINKWPRLVHHAFFADRITVRRQTGYSPYFLLYGTEPLLPFDLAEASFMSEAYHPGMTAEELLIARIQQLQKKPEDIKLAAKTLKDHRIRSKKLFEQRFHARLRQDSFEPGSLVLVRNSATEMELNRKTKPRYLGPYQVVRAHDGGRSYILAELDGTIWNKYVATFRIIPYITRNDPRLHALTGDNSEQSEESEPESADEDDNTSSPSDDSD